MTPRDALLVVDVQNDFCPGGALPVPCGDEVVPVLNRWIEQAERDGALVVLTRDWHPPDHCSFKDRGGPWPPHCVRKTPGAAYHPDLRLPQCAIYIDKARDPDRESYSGFEGTGLAERLRLAEVQRLWVGGLALDYCVKGTVLDGLAAGFEVHVIRPATRAVDVLRGDGQRALEEMRSAGAIIEEDPL
ncbi:MAG: nicotinamidase [Planctomycetota bacterium]|jgi:nicotinamidase/pyrazinamidase